MQWHIRLGPDTDISFEPLDNLGWDYVDVRRYTYDELNRLGFEGAAIGILGLLPLEAEPSQEPMGPATPAERREGSAGGPERRG